jgi:hypothetical protein
MSLKGRKAQERSRGTCEHAVGDKPTSYPKGPAGWVQAAEGELKMMSGARSNGKGFPESDYGEVKVGRPRSSGVFTNAQEHGGSGKTHTTATTKLLLDIRPTSRVVVWRH